MAGKEQRNDFASELRERLGRIREQGLYRELRRVESPQGTQITIAGRPLLNFSSNDYLGLANDPLLKEAAIEAVEKFGAGAGASRLICGSLSPHHDLDEALADFKGTEAALSFSSGYAAAAGAIVALMGKDDVVIVDKLVHACLVDAARLSGAKLRVFAHNDLVDLDQILRWATERAPTSRLPSHILIVTESVFSMDGDHARLRELADLKDRYGA
jgi:7-keto-8-aminopelargonate synthetase-like enzyme